MTPGDSEEGCTGGRTRIRDGFLTLRTAKGNKKRWVVFQGDTSTGIFQLKLFKHSNERKLKIAHTISKDTFVGIERGDFEASTRRGQKSDSALCYLAILLVTDTVLFHDDMSNLVKWHSGFKEYFNSSSWEVVPTTGVAIPESKAVLHITQHAISLASLNPPKLHQRWQLGKVTEYGVWGARVYFQIDSSAGWGRGHLEVKASTPDQANRIGDAIGSLLPNVLPGRQRRVSRDSFLPSPLSPLPSTPGHAPGVHAKTAFAFPPSSPQAAVVGGGSRATVSPGPVPPPVSPRPATVQLPAPPRAASSPPPKSPLSLLKLGPPPR